MSPDTFGSPDSALSPRFDVQSIPQFDTGTGTTPNTGTNTGTGTTPNTGTNTGTGTENVPCGLGRNVSVLKKALDGTTSTVTVKSPPCEINWGKAPTGSNVPNFPEKTPEDFKTPFAKLPAFFGDGKWFPVSPECKIPSIDLSQANVQLLRPFAIEYKMDIVCDMFKKIETLMRTVAMIGWFFLALWRVLDA